MPVFNAEADAGKLAAAIKKLLNEWHTLTADGGLPAASAVVRARAHRQRTAPALAARQVVEELLDDLHAAQPDAAALLRLRFLHELTVDEVGRRLSMAERTVHLHQKNAIHSLAERLAARERRAHTAASDLLARRLQPPLYSRLFGAGPALALLEKRAAAPPPWAIMIQGIGGIGKSTLADAAARRLLRSGAFLDCVWVTARRQSLDVGGALAGDGQDPITAESLLEELARRLAPDTPLPAPYSVERAVAFLRPRLESQPTLVVFDNLETVADVEALLPALPQLANPALFLLTSREPLHSAPNLFHLPVAQLEAADALALVRWEAQLHNLPTLAAAADAELAPIYETVGGNPLALRLVVGQCVAHALPDVLADLAGATSAAAQNLYSYVYRRAWLHLDETARRVLLAMVLTPPAGEGVSYIALVSQLPEQEVRSALAALAARCLVDAGGDLAARRYSIHSLTRTFLHDDIARW